MKQEIRTVKADELAELEKVAVKVWHQSYDGLIGVDQVNYMIAMFQNEAAFRKQISEGYIYRGLYVDDKLVGYTGSVREENRIFISKLYLLEEYRGLGLGRKLLEDVIAIYPQYRSFYLTVNKHNPTFGMYEHFGFKVIDAVVSDIGSGYVMDDYIMQLDVEDKQ